ncbi:MAG: flagellar motor switch protein FliG [Peptococcaceae bacterium]|nr:flagellar motor switch protein FliG [Peptococcaceae bacterium]MDH7524033.1 flagellar motor switch protein FliG [Peptococcaceae bacterium]
MSKVTKLTGRQKAAVFLISLGPENSARVMKYMSDEEIEQLTLEIAHVRTIKGEQLDTVIEEFGQLYMASQYIAQGGIEYAKQVLERALGNEKALDIINRLSSNLQIKPFDFVRKTDPGQILNLLQGEHPQTIALIMSYLEPQQAAAILSALPAAHQSDVARRIAIMDRTSPEIVREVENVLERKISALGSQDYTSTGGVKAIVNILNKVDRATEKTILETLEVQDPELSEEIKKLMFVFEDITKMDDRSIQLVLREVDGKDLALALKGSSEEVATKIKKNMSKRAGQMLEEDMAFLGPVRLRDVEDAQQRIVNIIRRLEDSGEIIISRGGGDELIV